MPVNTNSTQKIYGIVTNPNTWFAPFTNCPDHTTGSGNMMVIDGSTSNGGTDVVWRQQVPVTTGSVYTFSYWVQSVALLNYATLQVRINGVSLGIAQAPSTIACGNWTQVTYTWNSVASTVADIAIINTNNAPNNSL